MKKRPHITPSWGYIDKETHRLLWLRINDDLINGTNTENSWIQLEKTKYNTSMKFVGTTHGYAKHV